MEAAAHVRTRKSLQLRLLGQQAQRRTTALEMASVRRAALQQKSETSPGTVVDEEGGLSNVPGRAQHSSAQSNSKTRRTLHGQENSLQCFKEE